MQTELHSRLQSVDDIFRDAAALKLRVGVALQSIQASNTSNEDIERGLTKTAYLSPTCLTCTALLCCSWSQFHKLAHHIRRLTCQMRVGELGAVMSSTNKKLRVCMAACMRENMLHDEMIRDSGLARIELDGLLNEQVAVWQALHDVACR